MRRLANGGVVMNPYLVDEVLAPDLSVLSRGEPSEFGRAVSPEIAQEMTDMLVNVVQNGTGSPPRSKASSWPARRGPRRPSPAGPARLVPLLRAGRGRPGRGRGGGRERRQPRLGGHRRQAGGPHRQGRHGGGAAMTPGPPVGRSRITPVAVSRASPPRDGLEG